MKKPYSFLLLTALACAGLSAQAQPVVNADFWPVLGATGSHQQEVIFSAAQQVAPAGGLNKTWDYSALTNPGEINPFGIEDTTGMNLRGAFAGRANFHYRYGLAFGSMMRYDGSGIAELGYGNGDTLGSPAFNSQVYDRPMLILPLGLQYQQSYSDSINVYRYSGGTRLLVRTISYVLTYAGTGTLKVKDATDGSLDTYANCIMVQNTMRWHTPNGSGGFITETFDQYDWYNTQGAGVPLATWLHHTGGAQGNFYRFDRLGDLSVPANMRVTNAGFLPRVSGTGIVNTTDFTSQAPAEGPRKVWDYAASTVLPGSTRRLEVKTGPASSFPVAGANLSTRVYDTSAPNDNDTYFYSSGEGGIMEIGRQGSNGQPTAYSKAIPYFRIPMQLGQTTRDSIGFLPGEYQVSITRFAGYGTLKLPNGIVDTNTILMKVDHRHYVGGVVSSSGTVYRFYSPNLPLGRPYASAEFLTGSGYSLNYVSDFAVADRPAVSQASILVSPNPAGSTLSVLGLTGLTHATVLDAQGRTVCSVVLKPGSDRMDISSLKPGLYVLSVKGASGPVTQRFVKE